MSKYLTLYPGDVLWMGTDGAPENMKHGDVIEVARWCEKARPAVRGLGQMSWR
jgi:2-keto-4-pentenoate hydratase/2-oxohepta-3-ene-1,7-dioic acid hydratase in catechol pathway